MMVTSTFGTKREKANARQYKADATPGPRAKHAVVSRPSIKNVLVIDVGGTSVKILATGQRESRSLRSGPTLTPRRMASRVKKLAADWTYDAISIGYPGPVLNGRPSAEPVNLGRGWIAFDFEQAFGRPVKIMLHREVVWVLLAQL